MKVSADNGVYCLANPEEFRGISAPWKLEAGEISPGLGSAHCSDINVRQFEKIFHSLWRFVSEVEQRVWKKLQKC